MFVVDVSRSMAKTRTVELPDGPHGEARTKEMTNLEWSLQFVKLKIQEMVCMCFSLSPPNSSRDLQWTENRPMWRCHLWGGL